MPEHSMLRTVCLISYIIFEILLQNFLCPEFSQIAKDGFFFLVAILGRKSNLINLPSFSHTVNKPLKLTRTRPFNRKMTGSLIGSYVADLPLPSGFGLQRALLPLHPALPNVDSRKMLLWIPNP